MPLSVRSSLLDGRADLPPPPSPAPRVHSVRPALAAAALSAGWLPARSSSRGGRGRPSDDSDGSDDSALGPKQGRSEAARRVCCHVTKVCSVNSIAGGGGAMMFWISFLTLVSLFCETTSWRVINIEDYGASSGKDSTDAIQESLRAASSETDGGEVHVPPGKNYYTAPLRVSSNTIFRIDGNLTALANKNAYPIVDILPSLDAGGAIRGHSRHQPLIYG